MSDENDHNMREPMSSADDFAIKALLKRSVEARDPSSPDLLPRVQERIRKRSRGKFFADGWSTSASSVSYVLIAVCTLVVLAIAYFALGPTGITAG